MQHLNTSLIFILTGIGLVTIIDAAGSIMSRKLNFSYGYFSVLSFLAYTFIGYLMSEKTNSMLTTMIVVMLIGFYDGTVGWKICQKLQANYGKNGELVSKITIAHAIFAGVMFSIVCGGIGIFLASW